MFIDGPGSRFTDLNDLLWERSLPPLAHELTMLPLSKGEKVRADWEWAYL